MKTPRVYRTFESTLQGEIIHRIRSVWLSVFVGSRRRVSPECSRSGVTTTTSRGNGPNVTQVRQRNTRRGWQKEKGDQARSLHFKYIELPDASCQLTTLRTVGMFSSTRCVSTRLWSCSLRPVFRRNPKNEILSKRHLKKSFPHTKRTHNLSIFYVVESLDGH